MSKRPTSITAADLMQRRLRRQRYVITNLLPEGLSILAAKAKTGKSWWALAASVAVTNGTEFMGIGVNRGQVLYLALEDTLQRLRSRLSTLCQHDAPSDGLHFQLEAPRIGEGFMEHLHGWLKANRRCRMVVVDTLGRVAPKGGKATYHHQYEVLAQLKSIADRRRVAVLVVHHLRKAGAANWVDGIPGSSAVSGAADALLHLARPRNDGEAVLSVTGRDIEEREVGLHFDATHGNWSIADDSHGDFLSPERRRIVDLLESRQVPVLPKVVSDSLGLNPHSTRKVMARMCRQRLLLRVADGYVPANRLDRGSLGSLGSPGLDLASCLDGIDDGLSTGDFRRSDDDATEH